MKKNHVKMSFLALMLILSALFFSCEMEPDPLIAIEGHWVYSGTYPSELTVTENTVDFGGWAAEIQSFSNESWNGGESSTLDGSYGYAVIQYSEAPDWNPDLMGQYGVIRWRELSGNTMSYSEAFYDPDGDWTGNYFDTAAEAEETMTDANSCFSMYTSGMEKQ